MTCKPHSEINPQKVFNLIFLDVDVLGLEEDP